MELVFDIGGTNMRIGASRDGRTIAEPTILPTNPHDFQDSIGRLLKAAKELAGGQVVTGIAGGIPGPMDTGKTMVVTAPNLPDWNNQPLKSILEKELACPAYLENDTAMIGLGEALAGAGQGNHIVAYLTVSTGVGGCRIVDGHIDVSALGFEPGHHIIDVNSDIACACGGTGHLEGFIGGASLEKQYGKKPEHIDDSEVWQQAARYLAVGLHNILNFWSPDIVIVGGSIMNKINLDETRQHLEKIVTVYKTIPLVSPAALADKAGLIGSLEFLKSKNNLKSE